MAEQYFTHKESHDLLVYLRAKKALILVIERILLQEDGTFYADIGGIADFSDATPEESYEATELFLSEYGEDANERFIFTID